MVVIRIPAYKNELVRKYWLEMTVERLASYEPRIEGYVVYLDKVDPNSMPQKVSDFYKRMALSLCVSQEEVFSVV